MTLAALLAVGQGGVAQAQAADPTRVRFAIPIVGAVPGETIRVSVTSLRSLPPRVADRARIRLFDARGRVVADSGPLVLSDLQSELLVVPRERLGPGEEGTDRIDVRAVVTITNPRGIPFDSLRAGFEIQDTATGRTTLAVYPPGPSRF